jgi:hypothetical protein
MSTKNANGADTPARRVNMDEIVASWSREDVRKSRDDNSGGKMKVRSLDGNIRPLRGGDWLSSGWGLMTLGVAWVEHYGDKQYGLTVGHAFTDNQLPSGSSVWAFNSDQENPTTGKHKSIKIGTVLSIDTETDTAIIEIFPSIKIDPLAVTLSGGNDKVLKIELPKPFTKPTGDSLPYGETLIFGATRRGMIGVRVPRAGDNPCDPATSWATRSHVSTAVGRMDPSGQTKLSFGGDCGALSIDSDGKAWSMHTMIQGLPKENPTTWTSHGASLERIVNAHAFYFGHTAQIGASNASLRTHHSSPASTTGLQHSTISVALDRSFAQVTGEQYPLMEFESLAPGSIRIQHCPQSCIPMEFSDEEGDNNNGVEEEKKTIISLICFSLSSFYCTCSVGIFSIVGREGERVEHE